MVLALAGAVLAAGPARADATLPGCSAAREPAHYDPILEVPREVVERIEAYRLGWRRLCAGERGNVSLHELMLQAREIERVFEPLRSRQSAIVNAIEDEKAMWRRAQAVHDLLETTLPAFIPGFVGSAIEWGFFQPHMEFFARHASLGDEEDGLALGSGILVDGSITAPHPWFEYTWDYGGCYRFGQFDWAAEIEKIDELRRRLHRELYRSALVEYERVLLDALSLRRVGRVCGDPDSVASDLEGVLAFLARRGRWPEGRRAIEEKLAELAADPGALEALRRR